MDLRGKVFESKMLSTVTGFGTDEVTRNDGPKSL
jgi:hypothetical protein